ncbi:hypothetical protein FQZ97_965870 [compost metagenome]
MLRTVSPPAVRRARRGRRCLLFLLPSGEGARRACPGPDPGADEGRAQPGCRHHCVLRCPSPQPLSRWERGSTSSPRARSRAVPAGTPARRRDAPARPVRWRGAPARRWPRRGARRSARPGPGSPDLRCSAAARPGTAPASRRRAWRTSRRYAGPRAAVPVRPAPAPGRGRRPGVARGIRRTGSRRRSPASGRPGSSGSGCLR